MHVQRHDCYTTVNSPCCAHALVDDTTCIGTNSSRRGAWKSMDCDWVTIIKPGKDTRANKWLAVPHGTCDSSVQELGDWASKDVGVSLYLIRPCLGMRLSCLQPGRAPNKTYAGHVCDAIHASWTYPGKPHFGLNDVRMIDIYEKPGNQILW